MVSSWIWRGRIPAARGGKEGGEKVNRVTEKEREKIKGKKRDRERGGEIKTCFQNFLFKLCFLVVVGVRCTVYAEMR